MQLQDIAKIIRGRNFKKEDLNDNGDVIIITPKNLRKRQNLMFEKKEKRVTSDVLKESDLIQEGDILLNTTGSLETIGNFCVYDLPMKAIPSEHIVVLRPLQGNLDELLEKNYYRIKELSEGSTTINRVSVRELSNFELKE